MKSNTLSQFIESKNNLLRDYQSKLSELREMEEELTKLGIDPSQSSKRKYKVGKAKGIKAKGGKRVDGKLLEHAIMRFCENAPRTHQEIQKSGPVERVYEQINKPVPNLFLKLDEMVKAKALKSEGSRKSRTYIVVP